MSERLAVRTNQPVASYPGARRSSRSRELRPHIFSDQRPEKVGEGRMFISLNVAPETHKAV
jgi:hypothetical protein